MSEQEIRDSVNAVIEELRFLLTPGMMESHETKGTDGVTIFSSIVACLLEVMRERDVDYRTRLLLGILRFTGCNPEEKSRMQDLIEIALDFKD